MVSPNSVRPWRWVGATAGIGLGVIEYVSTRVVGGVIEMEGADVTAPLFVFFGLTYGAFGWSLGRLLEVRRRMQRDAATIEAQHAKVLQYEKLASIGRLAAGVAHEVRNSLGVVGSSSALLLESLEGASEDQLKAGRFIKEEIGRLDGFVRALLDFSKPVQPAIVDVDVPLLLARVCQLAGRETGEVVIESHSEGDATHCRADPDLLTQVLLALTLNARESLAGGGRVCLSAHRANGEVRFEVADDGPGVAAADARRIFEPFFTTKTEGTGLGLPMAERIARAHEGQLELVESGGLGERGVGACFRVRLPVAS